MTLAGRFSFFMGVFVALAALPPAPASAEIAVSVFGGSQWTQPSTIRSATLGEDRVRWESRPFEMPPYYGLRATWWQGRDRGLGLTFTHAKAYADVPGKYGYDTLNFSHGLNLLTADVWHRFETTGKITPYVGLGLGVAIPHVEVRPTGQNGTSSYQFGGPAVSLMIGASMPIGENWSVFTEYVGSFARVRAELDTGDKLDADFRTGAVNFGLSLHF